MMFARQDVAKLVGMATAVVALALATPGTAGADQTDYAFMKKLFDDGINFSAKDKAVARAREVCQLFAEGRSPAGVHEQLLADSAFSERQAAIFMADAVQAYCPDYGDLFIR
jgi:Protein of unknown function (DUF732)